MVATVDGGAPTVSVCCGRKYRETAYEAIIPSVRAGNFNVGISSLTDTKEREAAVDFVAYFEAGTLSARRPGGGSIRTRPAG